MRRRLLPAALVFAALPFLPLPAQEMQAGGRLQTELSTALPQTENAGDLLRAVTGLWLDLHVYAQESSLYASGSLSYDALGAQSAQERLGFVGGDGSVGIRLHEAWYDYDGTWWGFRAGRQMAAWGKADGLQVADVLCPQDCTVLSAGDLAESRLGIDAVRLSLYLEGVSAEAYWIPLFTPAALPLSQGSPLRAVLLPDAVQAAGMTFSIAPVTEESLTLPKLSLSSGEYALRVGTYLPAGDFSLYAFYGWDDLPLLAYRFSGAQSIAVTGSYARMGMIGADAAIPLHSVTLRLEGAVFPERAFSVAAEKQLAGGTDVVRRTQVVALAGIDWMPGGWTITAQYRGDLVCGDLDPLARRRYEHTATVSVGRSFLSETLGVTLTALLGLNDLDGALTAEATYSLTDQITLTLTGSLFFAGPDADGTYGAYKDLSSVALKGTFRF